MRHRFLLAIGILAGLTTLATARPLTLIAYGDSLTAGYGLPAKDSFPVKLEAALRAKGLDVAVVNAGVSGDTTRDGLARLDWTLAGGGDAIIVELGANDMLRGFDPAETRKTFDQLLGSIKARNLPTLVAGMRATPSLGPDYVAAFDPIFKDLADKHGAAYYPFFLDGVAGNPALNQDDGIHPTAAGVDIIVTNILPAVEALILEIPAKP